MPELPEVETIKRKLGEIVMGLEVAEIDVLKDKSFRGNAGKIINKKIKKIKRRAKIIIFEFENGMNLIVHLKMTGQIIVINNDHKIGGGHPTADWINDLPTKHTRVIIRFVDGTKLFFNDMRIFGWMKVVDADQLINEFKNYGPDINTDDVTTDYLFSQFKRRSIPIKQAIMLNIIVAGVGNIYACDALNLAKISPLRPAKSLSNDEVSILLKSTKHVINTGIELGGATIDDYVNVAGFAGKYQDVILVYGREKRPCKNCGNKISKIKVGGRGTYYCDSCQI